MLTSMHVLKKNADSEFRELICTYAEGAGLDGQKLLSWLSIYRKAYNDGGSEEMAEVFARAYGHSEDWYIKGAFVDHYNAIVCGFLKDIHKTTLVTWGL